MQGNSISKQWAQYLAAATASMTLLCYGIHYGWPSPFLPRLLAEDSPIPMTSAEGGWVSSMPLYGAIIGAPLCALTVDIIGRRMIILLISLPYVLSWIMVGFTNSVIVVCLARFIGGISAGASFTVVPMYIGEIAESSIRGSLATSISLQWNLGIVLVYCIGPYVGIPIMSLIAGVIPIALFVMFYFMPESPYFLLLKSKTSEAEDSLKFLRRTKDVKSELLDIQNSVEEQKSKSGSIKEMFVDRCNRRGLLIMIGITVAQEFSGRAAFSFYSQIIFEEAGGHISSSISSIIYALTQLMVSFIASFLVDRWGRRPLLILSCIGSAFSLGLEGTFYYLQDLNYDMTHFTWVPLAGLLAYNVLFSIGLGVIPFIIGSEVFSTSIKSKSLCLVDLFAAMTSAITAKSFQVISDSFGIAVPFWAFTISCLISLVFIYFGVPETKGKSLDDIQLQLSVKSSKSSNIHDAS